MVLGHGQTSDPWLLGSAFVVAFSVHADNFNRFCKNATIRFRFSQVLQSRKITNYLALQNLRNAKNLQKNKMGLNFGWRDNTMGKPVDRAYEWTVEELAAVVKRLTVAAEVFEDFRQIAEESPTKTLASHNRLTFLRAMTNLDSAVGAIQKAIWLAKTGNPLESGQLKPKSPEHARKRNDGPTRTAAKKRTPKTTRDA